MAALLAGLGSVGSAIGTGLGSVGTGLMDGLSGAGGATGLGGIFGQLLGGSVGSDINKDTNGASQGLLQQLTPAPVPNNPAQTNVTSNPSGTSAQGAQGVTNPYQQTFQGFAPLISHLLGQ